MTHRIAIELPQRMRTLMRDERGYPIPYLVMIDKSGKPQFTINDERKAQACETKHLCAICGKRFERNTGQDEMWFVGGSRCFVHDRGAFLDPPLHRECAEYALRVCPFLAARNYSKRIDDAKLSPEARPDRMSLVRANYVQPSLPERFGLGLCHAYRTVGNRVSRVFVVDDWRYVEWWHAGERIEAPDAETMADLRNAVMPT